MNIEVSCQGCRKRYNVPESAAGKKLRCKACGATIVVPADEVDPFDDSNALMAMEQSATPQPAPYLPPLPKQRTAVSSKTILLISAAAGGVVAIVAIVLLIVHFTGSQPQKQSAGSNGQNNSSPAPGQVAIQGPSIESRLAEIWNVCTQYAAAHDGRFPATLEEAGHPELRKGNDRQRGIDFTLGMRNLESCKAPLPAKMIVAGGMGPRDVDGGHQSIVLFGDGHIQTLDKKSMELAEQASSQVQWDPLLWLASDSTTPKGVAVRWYVALGMGDGEVLKATSFNVKPELIEAIAAQKAATHEFVAAAAKRFGDANNFELHPRTQNELARDILQIMRNGHEKIDGEYATIGEDRPTILKKIDGTWRMNAAPFFDDPSPAQTQIGTLALNINTRATREVTQEIPDGKHPDWPAAKQAVLQRMNKLGSTDTEFQQAVKANRGVPIPKFAFYAPWYTQQATIDHPAAPPVTPPPPIAVTPAPDKPATAVTPAATVDVTPILPDPNDKPEHLRTEIAGGKGGGPIETRSPNDTPIIGFHYALGRWGNQAVVQRFEPIFQTAPDKPADDKIKTLLARNGYVVGGLVVDFDDTNVIAVRVIFARKKADQIDAKDQYRSEWIGTPAGKHQQQLAGKGESIIGTFGRQGLNVGALGLLMPSNLRKTALLGGKGGGPFTSAGNGEKLVVGFRYTPGNWNGPVIGHFAPLYDPAGNDPPSPDQNIKSAKTILARDGYAVGGLIADFDDVNFFAFRVIFIRQEDGQLDPKDQYTSDWIGTPKGKSQQLAGNGETIVGIFGRQGMNCDAIGLFEKRTQGPAATNPTQPK